jgi:hypothetical protein
MNALRNFVITVLITNHYCYVVLLKSRKLSDKFMYVFFDTECTQVLVKRDGYFEHVPNLISAKEMCSKCQTVDDLNIDCEQCGKRSHVFWEDPIGKFFYYLRLSRPFADKICYFTQHTTRSFC